jgi:hypothetical protein
MTSISHRYASPPLSPEDLPLRVVFADTGKLAWPSGDQPGLQALADLAQQALRGQSYALARYRHHPPPPRSARDQPRPLAQELQSRTQTVGGNRFQTERSLHEYMINCGPLLAPALARIITRGGAWLDVGSGHVAAMAEFRRRAGNVGRLVAVTAGPFDVSHGYKHTFSPPPNVLCLPNRRIETVFPAEVGRFEVVTDVLGALSYCDQPDVVLRRMLELAQVGGLVFFSTGFGATTLSGRDGSALSWEDWLRPASGARLLETGLCDEYGVNQWFVLEKTSQAVGVQRLALESFVAGKPPVRRYRLLNSR